MLENINNRILSLIECNKGEKREEIKNILKKEIGQKAYNANVIFILENLPKIGSSNYKIQANESFKDKSKSKVINEVFSETILGLNTIKEQSRNLIEPTESSSLLNKNVSSTNKIESQVSQEKSYSQETAAKKASSEKVEQHAINTILCALDMLDQDELVEKDFLENYFKKSLMSELKFVTDNLYQKALAIWKNNKLHEKLKKEELDFNISQHNKNAAESSSTLNKNVSSTNKIESQVSQEKVSPQESTAKKTFSEKIRKHSNENSIDEITNALEFLDQAQISKDEFKGQLVAQFGFVNDAIYQKAVSIWKNNKNAAERSSTLNKNVNNTNKIRSQISQGRVSLQESRAKKTSSEKVGQHPDEYSINQIVDFLDILYQAQISEDEYEGQLVAQFGFVNDAVYQKALGIWKANKIKHKSSKEEPNLILAPYSQSTMPKHLGGTRMSTCGYSAHDFMISTEIATPEMILKIIKNCYPGDREIGEETYKIIQEKNILAEKLKGIGLFNHSFQLDSQEALSEKIKHSILSNFSKFIITLNGKTYSIRKSPNKQNMWEFFDSHGYSNVNQFQRGAYVYCLSYEELLKFIKENYLFKFHENSKNEFLCKCLLYRF